LSILLLCGGFALWSGAAGAMTLGFGSASIDRLDLNGPIIESGFQHAAVIGDAWEIRGHQGHPAGALTTRFSGATSTAGQMVELTRVGGGLFSFDSVEASSGTLDYKPRDQITITGYRGGVAVGSTALGGDTLNYLAITSSFAALADTLRIAVTATGPASLSLDNLR
jgi:hypothetical protein